MSMDIENKEPEDIISALPDGILTHIMGFLMTKEAVQTSVLSNRWKNLWKYLRILKVSDEESDFFKKFVCEFLNKHQNSLHTIDIKHPGYLPCRTLDSIIENARSNQIKSFIVDLYIREDYSNVSRFVPIFSLTSLTSLNLMIRKSSWIVKLPVIVNLPELVDCRLSQVTFDSGINKNFSKPFLKCKKLATLVIENCELINGKTLYLAGDKLINLIIRFSFRILNLIKFMIDAPNLEVFCFASPLSFANTGEMFERKLNFVKEATIDVCCDLFPSDDVQEALMRLFKTTNRASSLKVCFQTMEGLSRIHDFPNIESLGFAQLKSLTVTRSNEMPPLPDGVLEYLLQDAPLARINFIEGDPWYTKFTEVK